MARCKCYVAMCDILGFKTLTLESELQDLVEKYSVLRDRAREVAEHRIHQVTKKAGYSVAIENVPYVVFSDTVLMWTEVTPEPRGLVSVLNFFDTLGAFVTAGLTCGMPMRVGVAYGECHIDPASHTYLGKPIVDAWVTQEAQEWIGGACHESCENGPHFRMVEGQCLVIPYMVPTKRDGQICNQTCNLRKAIQWVPWADVNADDMLRHLMDQAKDARVRLKYANTINFYNVTRPPTCVDAWRSLGD